MKALVLAFVLFAAARVLAVDVTTCGQTVAPREIGTLTADLDCSSAAGAFAVDLSDRSTLELTGHTISGKGVLCQARCAVHGPGDITGAPSGIFVNGVRRPVTVSGGISLHGNGDGIYNGGSRLTLVDVDLSNNSGNGIFVLSKRVKGSNVTANDNGGAGLFAQQGSLTIDGLTANGNGAFGINVKRGKLLNSTLTGNQGGYPSNPPFVDVVSTRRPRLVNTVCDHSLGPNGTWGVCAQD
jgi:hypothetical protein